MLVLHKNSQTLSSIPPPWPPSHMTWPSWLGLQDPCTTRTSSYTMLQCSSLWTIWRVAGPHVHTAAIQHIVTKQSRLDRLNYTVGILPQHGQQHWSNSIQNTINGITYYFQVHMFILKAVFAQWLVWNQHLHPPKPSLGWQDSALQHSVSNHLWRLLGPLITRHNQLLWPWGPASTPSQIH